MKFRTLWPVAAAFAVLAAFASPASAQIREGTVEISPFAGYLFGGDFGDATFDTIPYDVEVDDDAVYGGRIGFNMTNLMEFELEYARDKTSLIRDSRGPFTPNPRLGGLTIQYFMGYATFNFGRGRLVPYFTVGSGGAHLTPRIPGVDTDSETRYTAGAGGGIKYFFNPHFALRFDGRAYSTYMGRSRVLCGRDHDRTCEQTNWLTTGGGNGGFVLAF